jgi:WD40 repeat protein
MFTLKNPYLKGRVQSILVSSSKDGFLKFWDLEQQSCVSSFSDELMTKVSDFIMVPELKAIVAGDDDCLRLYQVYINPKTYILDVKLHPKIKRESQGKVLELHYN